MYRLLGPIALIGAAVSTTLIAHAAPLVFHDHVPYAVGQMPSAVEVADLNGDAYPDLAVANVLSADVSVLLNRQDGTFDGEVRMPAGGQARSIAIGNLNGDAYPDLAVGLQSGPHALAVFFNNGNGVFAGPIHFESGGPVPFSTVIGTLDEDDRPDIAMARVFSSTGEVAVFLNGNGTFPDATVYDIDPDAFVGGLAIGDLDVDNDTDLVAIIGYSEESPYRLMNRGDGVFDLAAPFNSENAASGAIGVADFNGDEVDDIIASIGGLCIYLNDGTGAFGAPLRTLPEVVLSSATRLTLADMNRDGTTDVVIPGGLSDEVGVLLNDGAGHLGEESLHTTGRYAADAAVADFDGDQWPDIIVANREGNSVSILLSAPANASSPVEPVGAPEVWLDTVRPNPARSFVSIAYRGERQVPFRLMVYDAAGRSVSLLAAGEALGRIEGLSWDLRDALGRAVPPGIYFIRLETTDFRETRKLTVVR